MKPAENYDVGVLCGRFQVPSLHEGHRQLFEHVMRNHDKVLVFLGNAPILGSRSNPLPFEARKQMLLDEWPDLNVWYINDQRSDDGWSLDLDKKIKDLCTPNQTAVIYGSRDSLVAHYTGKFPVQALEATSYASGTVIRAEVSKKSTRRTPDFRAGVIWSTFNRYDTVYPTVDVAIWDYTSMKLLMARKPGEEKLRFVGGFASPDSASYEEDARREVSEETGIEMTGVKYLGSTIINDWRYRGERDKVKTLFFEGMYQFGSPRAADDIEEVRWVNADYASLQRAVVPEHQVLIEMLFNNRNHNGGN